MLATFDADGAVCLFTLAAAHLVVDVNGAFSPSEVDGTVRALAPTRLVDTRTTDTPRTGNEPFRVHVAERGGVHADATGVIVTVTVAEPAAIGFVTVYRCGEPTPLASNLNFVGGGTVANAVLAPVDAEGDLCIARLSTRTSSSTSAPPDRTEAFAREPRPKDVGPGNLGRSSSITAPSRSYSTRIAGRPDAWSMTRPNTERWTAG